MSRDLRLSTLGLAPSVANAMLLAAMEQRLAALERRPLPPTSSAPVTPVHPDLVDVDTTTWPNGLTAAFAPRGLVRSHEVIDGEHIVRFKADGQSTSWTSLMDRTLIPLPELQTGVAYEYVLEVTQVPPLDTGVFVGLALRDSALLDRHIICGGLWYKDTGYVRPISRVGDQVMTTTAELQPVGETHPTLVRRASLTFVRRGPGLSPLMVSSFEDQLGRVVAMGTRSDLAVVNPDRFMLVFGTQSMAAATARGEDPELRFRLTSRTLPDYAVPIHTVQPPQGVDE